jgi:propionyl-CoA carboxylase alpha chain
MLGRAAGISGQLPGHGVTVGEEFVVVGLGAAGQNTQHPVTVRDYQAQTGSRHGGNGRRAMKSVATGTWAVRASAAPSTASPLPRRWSAAWVAIRWPIRIAHNGTRLDALVLSPRAAQLHALMPYKAPPDMSRYVLSPMPGLLVDVAVQVGQKVQAGERVAVIEAMKMENVLFAVADGVVGKVLAAKGESLSVDQPIVEFQA